MDNTLFERLVAFIRGAASTVGLDPKLVRGDRGTVSLAGTGIDVWWARDALGAGRPGWQIRETYHAIDLMGGSDKVVSTPIVAVAPDDVYLAARTALLEASKRRLDSVLSELAARH